MNEEACHKITEVRDELERSDGQRRMLRGRKTYFTKLLGAITLESPIKDPLRKGQPL